MKGFAIATIAVGLTGCAHTEYRESSLTPVEKAEAQCNIEMTNLAGNNRWWFAPPIFFDQCMQGKGFLPIKKTS